MYRFVPLLLAVAFAASAQKYDGPRPPKPDIPYLKHADTLVPTDVSEAKEQKQKSDILYVIEGATSSAKTPLASPIFLIQADKVAPEKLGLYKVDTKGGHREILFRAKKPPTPIRIDVTRMDGSLWKIEVGDSLEP